MKRGYNTKESMAYLGVQRRFFERHIAPLLNGKGVKAGTSVIYERPDLDAAWDRYKLVAGSERANSEKGIKKWDVQSNPASTKTPTAVTRLMPVTGTKGFESAVSRATKRRRIT